MTAQIEILVAGAINTDLVATMDRAPEAGETISGKSFGMHGGGKAANQAVAVSRSGGRVALLGAVGDDDFGRARMLDLEHDRVDVGDVQVLAGKSSGVALILVEDGGENRIAYIPGTTMQVTTEAAISALDRTVPKYVLAPNELPREALAELFARGRDIGSTVVLNATPDPERVVPLLPLVSILVVNEGEAEMLAGGTHVSAEALAITLSDRYGCSVVITLGARGVVAFHEAETLQVPGRVVEAIDTTGAGDTFCGAFVADLAQGATFVEALGYANSAAALSVTRAGAQSSIPLREDVLAWLDDGGE